MFDGIWEHHHSSWLIQYRYVFDLDGFFSAEMLWLASLMIEMSTRVSSWSDQSDQTANYLKKTLNCWSNFVGNGTQHIEYIPHCTRLGIIS
jgi:hypothetical protein